MTTEFFLPMKPPTVTHQLKRTAVINDKQIHYEEQRLKNARAQLTAHLSRHIPESPYMSGVRLMTKWCYPIRGNHSDGDYKLTKPDTDNMIKLFKDVMTHLGYWKDDALVASELTEKFYSAVPGIYVRIEELPKNGYQACEV